MEIKETEQEPLPVTLNDEAYAELVQASQMYEDEEESKAEVVQEE